MLFDLQGHRGARGLRPENTLPSFEAALDACVTTVETDLHLTRDGAVVLCHDPALVLPGEGPTAPPRHVLIRSLSLEELRRFPLDRNPDSIRFPGQDPSPTPLARWLSHQRGFHPLAMPTLTDLFDFTAAYAGPPGREASKTEEQRRRAGQLRFDLELKRVPFHPSYLDDGFTGERAGLLEERVLETVRAAGVVARTNVRSFDHRSVSLLCAREPGLTGAVLIAHTAAADPAALAYSVGAHLYCPSFDFVDPDLIRRAHAGGVRVVPWTVNDPEHWQRLLDWGVDGITTDFPDRLADFLRQRGILF